ncbi:MAG: STAS domain-containing protein [Nitriliruptoraceae bacterium]|nr:STAS domain-containing protein [Nitriliruptoraceae bacterium]
MEDLVVDRLEAGGWQVLVVRGPLDVATAPAFRQTLQEAQYGGGHRVAVDLTTCEFLDSFGLGVLLGGSKRARTHDGGFAVIAPADGRIRHVLEVTGLDGLLTVLADRSGLVTAH